MLFKGICPHGCMNTLRRLKNILLRNIKNFIAVLIRKKFRIILKSCKRFVHTKWYFSVAWCLRKCQRYVSQHLWSWSIHFYSVSGNFSLNCSIKIDKSKFITDIDISWKIKKGIRGEICCRVLRYANNKIWKFLRFFLFVKFR